MKKDLKQLKFRCEHRGMREMDILMGGFFNMFFEEFSKEDIFQIDKYIIPLSDNDLYKCFLGVIIWPQAKYFFKKTWIDRFLNHFLKKILILK